MRSILYNLFKTKPSGAGLPIGIATSVAGDVSPEISEAPYEVDIDAVTGPDADHAYPPSGRRYPIQSIESMMASQDTLIRRIIIHFGGTPEMHQQYIYPVLENYARFVHLLPASENHHHSGEGGLWRHGLEVASLALSRCVAQESLSGYGVDPSKKDLREKQWRYAVFLASLLHDVGKAISDVIVVSPDKNVWVPVSEPLHEWCVREGIDYYYTVYDRERRHKQHERFTQHIMSRIVPKGCLDYLYIDVGKQIHEELSEALTPLGSTSRISDILHWSDGESVKQDLKLNNRGLTDNKLAHPVVHFIVKAMIEAVDDGEWLVNHESGGRVYVSKENDVFVYWDAAALDIQQRLKKQLIDGIPGNPDVMASLLIERRLAEDYIDSKGISHIYWMVQPSKSQQVVRCLKLSNDLDILQGREPRKVDIHVLTDDKLSEIRNKDVAEEPEQTFKTEEKAPVVSVDPVQTDIVEEINEQKAQESKPLPEEITKQTVNDKEKILANNVIEEASKVCVVLKPLLEDCSSGKRQYEKDWFISGNAFCLKHPQCIEGYGIAAVDVTKSLNNNDLLKLDPSKPMVPVVTITHKDIQVRVLRLNEELSRAFIGLVGGEAKKETQPKQKKRGRNRKPVLKKVPQAKKSEAVITQSVSDTVYRTESMKKNKGKHNKSIEQNTVNANNKRSSTRKEENRDARKKQFNEVIGTLAKIYQKGKFDFEIKTESGFMVVERKDLMMWTLHEETLGTEYSMKMNSVFNTQPSLGVECRGSQYFIPLRLMEVNQ